MAGEKSSRSRTTRNEGAATKAAEKKRARRHAETSKDLSRAGDGSLERPRRGGEHAEPAELESLSLDSMPDQLNKHLNKQKEFIQGLMELLKESLDKLHHEIDLLKEKNAGWKKLHENSSSSMKMLQALVMEQKEELAKLRIEHPAAVKVHNAVVEAMKKQLRLRGELDHLG